MVTTTRQQSPKINAQTENNPPCPFCGGHSKGKTHPPKPDTKGNYERRRTYQCRKDKSHKFDTVERLIRPPILVIKKRVDEVVVFDRDKIAIGIHRAAAYLISPAYRGEGPSIESKNLAKKVCDHLFDTAIPKVQAEHSEAVMYSSAQIGEAVLYIFQKENILPGWIRFALKFYGNDVLGLTSVDETLDFLKDKLGQYNNR